MRKIPLKDRYMVENGIPTIRPLRHDGTPGVTQAEADAAIAKFKVALDAYLAAKAKREQKSC